MARQSFQVGVDTGGTFTDVVLVSGSRVLARYKLLSTPDNPARAVIKGIQVVTALVETSPAEPAGKPGVVHGSTVATNALLEGKGAKVAFITTRGFEDTVFIGRQNRPELYALEPEKPPVPIEPECCLGLDERILHDGSVRMDLADEELANLVTRLQKLGVEAVAVSLLHSYANPQHEQLVAKRLRDELPGLHLTVSHEVLPEFREYERGSTCLVNAVVGPPMASYIGRLDATLGAGRLRVMASAGGSLPPEIVAAQPVHTILSGPAGGVVGALNDAMAAKNAKIITLDMGGTSTDVSLCDGQLSRTTESRIAGLPVRLPMIDIHTVGAGGGSVAWVDGGGALRVGPESMGASPGPACYGRQEAPYRATVTDAHAVLGHLPVGTKLGGDLELDYAAAHEAVRLIGEQCGLSVERAAFGILRVVEATMARAVQRISVERGYDLRDFTLMPFGGAGGFHAARLAQQMGMSCVLVPCNPGLLSALGMVGVAPLYTFSQAVMQRYDIPDLKVTQLDQQPAVRAAITELEVLADEALAAEGIEAADRVFEVSLDLRYSGQSYELTIPLTAGDTVAAFKQRHEQLYGYNPDKPLEVVAARLRAQGREHPVVNEADHQRGTEPLRTMPIKLHDLNSETEGVLVRRDDLAPGDRLRGPAVISEYSSTTLLPPGWQLTVNELGQLMLEPSGEGN